MKIFNIISALCFCVSIHAEQLDLKKVSDGSNWIMHMDFESMRSSEIGSFLEDSLEKIPEMEEKMRGLQKKFGVDLMGVSNLTLFGTGEKHKGIGIL
jgi:hypothetical protein